MPTPAEIAAGAAVETVLVAIAAGILYRVWGKFLPTPKRHTVPPFHVGVVSQGTEAGKIYQPGAYWISSKRTLFLCDMRPKPFQVPAQELLASDGMVVRISLGGEYRVANPIAFIMESSDPFGALYLELRHTLRVAVGELNSDAVISGHSLLTDRIRELLVPRAAQLGLELVQLQVWEAISMGRQYQT